MTATKTGAIQKLPSIPWIGKRPYYGWVIAAVGTIISFARESTSPQTLGTFFAPLQKEFGWSRAMLSGPRSIQQAEAAILGPLEGFLMDKLGPRIMVMIGSVIIGLGLIMFGLTHSLWMFYLSNIIVSLGTGFMSVMVLSVAVNHWFRRKRTMANAVMGLSFGLAGAILIPAVMFAQVTWGWRTSAILTGLLMFAVPLPLAMLLRRSPEQYGLLPDGDTPDPTASTGIENGKRQVIAEYDFTLREAIRTRSFWLLAAAQAASTLGIGVVNVHVFLYLEQGVGLSRITGAFVWSVVGMTSIPARLVGGFVGDRLPKNVVLLFAMALMAAAAFVLGLATSLPMALAFAVFYGVGLGVRTPLMNAQQGDYFGRKSQGLIRGWLALLALPFSVGAPVIAGYMADVLGNYRLVFISTGFVTLGGAILFLLATPPKTPTHNENTSMLKKR